jgi:hypothetical protein
VVYKNRGEERGDKEEWCQNPKIDKTFVQLECVHYLMNKKGGIRAGIFKESMAARNRGGMGYRTGPPGYIGWRNSFFGIDSWAP